MMKRTCTESREDSESFEHTFQAFVIFIFVAVKLDKVEDPASLAMYQLPAGVHRDGQTDRATRCLS